MAKVTKDHDKREGGEREKSQHEADSEVLSVKADFALVRKGTNENAGDWGCGRVLCCPGSKVHFPYLGRTLVAMAHSSPMALRTVT